MSLKDFVEDTIRSDLRRQGIEMERGMMTYKTYFCGCQASEGTPDYCPTHNLQTINYDAAWTMVMADDSLKDIRKRISISDLRALFNVAAAGLVSK